MAKVYDVGHKMGDDMGSVEMSKKERNKICYPSITLTDEECPYLKDEEIGSKLSLITIYEIVGIRANKNGPTRYDLEIQKVAEEKGMKMSKALEDALGEHEESEDESDKEEKEGK